MRPLAYRTVQWPAPAIALKRRLRSVVYWLITPATSAAVVGLVGTALLACHLIALQRGPRWASPLLIGDHLFDVLLAGAILWYATALGRLLGRPLADVYDDPPTRNLTALGLGTGALSLAILGLGFLRLFYGPVFLIGVLALTAALGGEMARMWAGGCRALAAWLRAGMPSAPTRLLRAVLLILLLALATALVRATNPVAGILVDWDAAAYHLASAKIYVALHRFVPLPAIPLANAPSSEEMLLVGGLLAGDESLGKALAVLFALALGLATYGLGRRLFEGRVGWLAVLLLFSTFWLVIVLPLTLTDFAETLCLVLGIGDLLVWLGRELEPDWLRAGDRLLVRAGLLLGCGVSFKLTGLPALPAAVLTLGLARLLVPSPAGLPERVAGATRACLILGVCALLPLAPWLLKNLYYFHSALYPIAVSASDPRQVTGAAGSTPGGMSTADHAWWIATTLVRFFQQFVTPLSMALIAAPLVLCKVSGRAALLFLVIGGILWLTFVPAFTPRYYLTLVVLGEIVTAATLYGLIYRLRLPRRICEAALAVYLLASGVWVVGTGLGLMLRDGSLDQALGTISADTYLTRLVRPYPAEAWVNAHTPTDTTVALVGVARGVYLDRPYLEDWYGLELAAMEADPRERLAEARRWCAQGVRYAVFDRGDDRIDDPAKAGIRPFASFAWVRQPGLRPRVLFSASGVDVVAIRPCGVG